MVKPIQTSNIVSGTLSPSPSGEANGVRSSNELNITSNPAKAEILKLYNLTEDQLNEILKQYPDFYSLPPEIQAKKVDEITKNKAAIIKTNEPLDIKPAGTEPEGILPKKSALETSKFDNKILDSNSNDELINIYALETAKNKFIYADSNNKKTLDDWNKLSDAEKQKLVEAEKQAYNASVKAKFLDDKEANKSLQYQITLIQAANKRGVTFGQLDKEGLLAKAEAVHEYIFELDETDRSAGQQRYLTEQQELSKALVEYCKKRGEDWGNGDYILSPQEIQEHCKRLGVNIAEVKLEYYNQLKQDKLNLTEDQQKDFDKLSKMSDFLKAVKEHPVKDYGRLTSLMKDEKFGSAYMATGNSIDDKLTIINKYIKTEFANLPDDERRTAILELASELVQQDPELATLFHEYVVGNADDADQKNIIKSDVGITKELNAYNLNAFTPKNSVLLAQDQKDMVAKDRKRAEVLALIAQGEQVDEEHLVATSSVYSGFGIKSVELKQVDNAYTRVGADAQLKMLSNVHANSCDEVAIYAGIHTDEAYAENQLALTEIASKRKVVNNAMIEDGTFNRYAEENIVPAFNMHKERCQESDYSHEESVNSLNLLSDQIQNCKYADKQLEMHNSMMDLDVNKYSEVIEHAAGNIKNYDPSVQGQAMDAVYQTGNKKAIEAGYSGLVEKYSNAQQLPPGVKDVLAQETTRAIFESAPQEAVKEFLDKFKSGNLSYSDIQKLPASQKREYYMLLFKQARPEEKLQLIKKVPNGTMKKSMLKMIAVINPTFFDYMITSDADFAKNIYEMDLNESINNKIKHIANQKGVSQNDFAEIKKDIEEKSYPPTARTLTGSGMTIPEGFNSKEIFPKDKNGYLLG